MWIRISLMRILDQPYGKKWTRRKYTVMQSDRNTFLILCRLTSLLTLVVCSRMVQRISFKNSTSLAIAIKYPYLDEIYFILLLKND